MFSIVRSLKWSLTTLKAQKEVTFQNKSTLSAGIYSPLLSSDSSSCFKYAVLLMSRSLVYISIK